MWNKIYSIVLAISVLAMGVLLYLPYSWLQSITDPRDVAVRYESYSSVSWMFLLISSLVLLVIANVVLWKTRRAWAVWTSLLYFAGFMVAYTFWLENAFFNYRQAKNLPTGIISWSSVFGVVLIVLAAIIVFFDQYLIKRLHDKTHPPLAPIESSPGEIPTDEKNI